MKHEQRPDVPAEMLRHRKALSPRFLPVRALYHHVNDHLSGHLSDHLSDRLSDRLSDPVSDPWAVTRDGYAVCADAVFSVFCVSAPTPNCATCRRLQGATRHAWFRATTQCRRTRAKFTSRSARWVQLGQNRVGGHTDGHRIWGKSEARRPRNRRLPRRSATAS